MIAHENNRREQRRQVRQAEIDARRTAADRNRLGQFATPQALAVEIAQYVATLLDPTRTSIRFADPSIGTGSFFSAALTVFGRDRIARAIGVEVDPAFCEAARDLWAGAGLEVVQGEGRVYGGGLNKIEPSERQDFGSAFYRTAAGTRLLDPAARNAVSLKNSNGNAWSIRAAATGRRDAMPVQMFFAHRQSISNAV